ncbi:IclR family transcriptional regulator [Geomesophilobacter sediminis]|uniref:IclR family transcriptional regulator n=1 Tax=Geomesophilobacter sediminis TaxID=2798584 RepID=A0A8J7IZB9_9BACT|nr:IclR family transcriptional regulator [Geomesophilobacter sediminis]MBJ6725462.1 IclR family transcriptional regulator [Geomesophilobacter sediminis]
MQETTDYTVRNVKKALELLELLAESPEEITLPVLSASLGFSPNKIYRLLATLIERGLVERNRCSGAYRLGADTAALARKLLVSTNLTRPVSNDTPSATGGAELVGYAQPILEQLARTHDEAVYMTVIKDNEVLFLNMVDSLQPVKTEALTGRKFPFFTNAAGKVMKAVDSWDLLEKICKRDERKGKQPDLDQLAREMQQIRATGVAIDHGGLGDGVISVAVAVRDYAGMVVGAITMLGPSFRMLTERLEKEIIPSLREGAELLSERFGYARAEI